MSTQTKQAPGIWA